MTITTVPVDIALSAKSATRKTLPEKVVGYVRVAVMTSINSAKGHATVLICARITKFEKGKKTRKPNARSAVLRDVLALIAMQIPPVVTAENTVISRSIYCMKKQV
jgi:hypothetical protein